MPRGGAVALDTGLYVYGVVPAVGGAHPELTGIDGSPVEYVEHGDLAAAVGRIALDRPPGRRAELVAHSEVVNALAVEGPVVPIRFGSVMADVESVVEELLASGHDQFVTLLDRLRGTTQLNLRVSYVEEQVLAEVVSARPDIAELRARTRDLPQGAMHPDLVRLGELVSGALEEAREHDAATVLDVVRPLVLAESLRPGGGLDHVLDVALLVDAVVVAELEQRLEDLAEAVHERMRLRLVGPMAPVDFVGDQPWG